MTIVADDFSPIYAGDLGTPFAPQFLYKDGSPVDLTGATINMIMVDAEGNIKIAAGNWTIDVATNGQAHYSYAASDVSTPGSWTLYITISINNLPKHADTKQLEILPVPTA